MKRTVRVSDLLDPTKDEELKKEIEILGKQRRQTTILEPYPDWRQIVRPKEDATD